MASGKRDRAKRVRPRVNALFRTSPVDHLMSLSESFASVPMVGKHLSLLGALTAAGLWVGGRAPGITSAAVTGMLTPHRAARGGWHSQRVGDLCEEALRGIVSAERLEIRWPAADRLAPVLRYRRQRRQDLYEAAVRYGDAPEQVLDIWRQPDLNAEPAPVLVFVPGGGWVHGRRALQGNALLSHLARRGWACLSIDYRVSPRHRWPCHLDDVKAAVGWARDNAESFGGDPDFVAIAGASAGGHLAALAGLTDPSVNAVVGLYGRYDWEDRSTPERERFMSFIERVVVKKRYDSDREAFRAASPIAQVGPHAPPFLVVHGTADTIIPVGQAAAFVDELRATSRAAVAYLELPGGHHGFDVTDGTRTPAVVTAIGLFLAELHQSHLLVRKGFGIDLSSEAMARRQ